MIKEATIIAKDSHLVQLAFTQEQACKSCKSCGDKNLLLNITTGKEIGDFVTLQMQSKDFLTGIFWLYLLPLLLLITSICLLSLVAEQMATLLLSSALFVAYYAIYLKRKDSNFQTFLKID